MPPPRTSTSAVLSCTPKRLFLVVLCLFAVILLTEVLMLPNLIGVAALPVPTTADNSAPDEGAQVAVAAPPASLRPVTGAPPNISVIMPCYGHVHFLEEALNSVIKQQYPPAEILVVDDGSPEECGKFASDMLDGSLASARRRSIRQLQTWWGWGDGDMVRFRDEVLVTPNRGVAHARNSGIRRARGDWIMCLDADDTVSPNYIMEAMAHVAQQPATNCRRQPAGAQVSFDNQPSSAPVSFHYHQQSSGAPVHVCFHAVSDHGTAGHAHHHWYAGYADYTAAVQWLATSCFAAHADVAWYIP